MNIPKELEFSTAARHRKKKIFAKKDMIMVFFHKERLSVSTYSKLQQKYGYFQNF